MCWSNGVMLRNCPFLIPVYSLMFLILVERLSLSSLDHPDDSAELFVSDSTRQTATSTNDGLDGTRSHERLANVKALEVPPHDLPGCAPQSAAATFDIVYSGGFWAELSQRWIDSTDAGCHSVQLSWLCHSPVSWKIAEALNGESLPHRQGLGRWMQQTQD